MSWCLTGTQPLSETMLEYCYWSLGDKFQWNFLQDKTIFIQENVFENVVWKMVSICLGLNVLHKVTARHTDYTLFREPTRFSFSISLIFPWFPPDITGNFPDVFCIHHWKLHYQLYMNHVLGDKCFSKYIKHCINAVLSFWYSCS